VVDNDLDAFGPSITALNSHVDNFDGIIVTNLFGMACNITTYTSWAAEHGKLCIFDNAATPMTFWNSANACVFGDGAIISLHETKPLGRGEGGAVICTPEMLQHLHRAQNFGFIIGAQMRTAHPFASNWRMSDIAAAFIQARLQMLTPAIYESANAIVREVDAFLQTPRVSPYIRWIVPVHKNVTTIFPSCLMLHTSVSVDVRAFCARYNIEARQYYVPLVPRTDAPVAWAWYSHCVCLPFNYMASDAHEALATVDSLLAYVRSM
jgi:dTDP-4-amino-4,6-dideoxygalactose transaminase